MKNNVNNKVYIGQTIMSVEARFKKHLSLQKGNKNMLIYKAIQKYGKLAFYVEILEECLVENLNKQEEFYINEYDSFSNGYNLCKGGGQPTRIRKEFSEIIIKDVVKLYNLNNSLRFIAEHLNITKHNVNMILLDNNIQLRPKTIGLTIHSKISESKLKELYTQKISIRGIAKILKVNPNAVNKALIKYNLKNINMGVSH